MTSKKDMIKTITEARHNDRDFFFCVFDIGDVNRISNKIILKMNKDDLSLLYNDAIKILEEVE